jgi:preprotein translocase SecE subunit
MAVAVKKEAETKAGTPSFGLAGASLLSTLYFVVGFIAVYHGIPLLYDAVLAWWTANVTDAVNLGSFMYQGVKLLLVAGGAAGLLLLWPRIFPAQPGLRAGTAFGVAAVIVGFWLVYLVSSLAQKYLLADVDANLYLWGGAAIAAAAAGLGLYAFVNTMRKPRTKETLVQIEEQGWFSSGVYKKGQGIRARRGTMIGLLLLIGAGLWVYAVRRGLTVSGEWRVDVPFDPERYIPILYAPRLTVAVFIAAIGFWLSFRLVNYPRFADFLIATDAEMNKVSWSTRKRLVQDTIVVLVTVALMAVFLLLVDLLWSYILSKLGVIYS